ncbi:MAG: helix-turn-helix transcriptional regulator [Lachnospiraceae bacterium]|nr:helix-turn-helix transcriptional regulator [Lachnospiraceae bacterium]
MHFDQIEFGKRMRELRRLEGMTQEKLAEEMWVSYAHINKLENGRGGCSLDLLLNLAEFFEVSTDYLLLGRDNMNRISRKILANTVDELTAILLGWDQEK